MFTYYHTEWTKFIIKEHHAAVIYLKILEEITYILKSEYLMLSTVNYNWLGITWKHKVSRLQEVRWYKMNVVKVHDRTEFNTELD